MTRIPESGDYRLVREKKPGSRLWELPEGAIILEASTRFNGGSVLTYLEPVEENSEGDA